MEKLDHLIGRQTRKPSGLAGRVLGHLMALEHKPLVDWMLESLPLAPSDHVLDVGCGGGMTLAQLALRLPRGHVAGIDHSEVMVRQARQRNRVAITTGRMDIVCGDVAALPFEANRFHAVCGVETFYFWQEPLRGLSEIWRVLRPAGRLAIVMDISKSAPDAPVPENVSERMGYQVYSGEELVALFSEAGFEQATFKARPERAKGWLCAYATKPVMSTKA